MSADNPRQGDRWWVLGVLLLGVAVTSYLASRPARQAGGFTPAGSRVAIPELEMAQLGGGTWRLAKHRGQVVLINDWATWCGPCREEMPGLAEVARGLAPKGLAVVGVSLDKGDPKVVQAFVDHYRVPYPVAFPAALSQVEQGMEGIPTTVLVDRAGRVVKTYVGEVRRVDFETDVANVLGEVADAR